MTHLKRITWLASLAILSVVLAACRPDTMTLNVSDSQAFSTRPRLAAVGGKDGTLYLAWRESGSGVVVTSAEKGSGFAAPTVVGPANVEGPELAAYGANVYVVWPRSMGAPGWDVFFAGSTDYGTSFASSINLSNNSGISSHPGVAASGENVYVAWTDFQVGAQEGQLLFRSSVDAGQSFSAVVALSTDVGVGSSVQVAALGDNVYVLWCDASGNSVLVTSSDAGGSFGTPQYLGNNCLCGGEGLFADGDNVYALWIGTGDSGYSDVFLRASPDGGTTFASVVNVSNTPGGSVRAQLHAYGANVYVVWQDGTDGHENVYFARSTDNGLNFSPWQDLSQSDKNSVSPQLSAGGSYVHVVWQDASLGYWDVFYRRSHDGGVTFEPFTLIPPGPANSLSDIHPVIVSWSDDRYIAWERGAPGSDQADIVFYSSKACPVWPSPSGPFPCLQ